MGLRHLTSRVLVGLAIGVLLAGCGSGEAKPPAATPTPTALPTAAATPTASPVTPTPTSTPKPTATPEPVAGWPTVGRALDEVSMTGVVENSGENDGRLRLSITVTGLVPGEAVPLRATGEYTVKWACHPSLSIGTTPEPCGELGCGPISYGETEGTATAAADAVAGSSGTAVARIEIVAAPPAGSCPTDPTAPWWRQRERWEKVRIDDPAHGLLLTPDTIERGVTF